MVMHQCYYCGQLFNTKEGLYDHMDVHTDAERNREKADRERERIVRWSAHNADGIVTADDGGSNRHDTDA